MAPEVAPLTPLPLSTLLGRVAHEWADRRTIFDLPTARFYDVSAGPDLTADFMGRRAATPVGPAAGPHSQLAENIVLSWLAGSRIVELKTVQVLDDLDIGRPCIDMETVGYNIEWSQELAVHESLEEYVKAWMMIEILSGWEELTPHLGDDPGPHVFDLSVGYDLEGIATDKVAGFIDGLVDASASIDRLRPQIPEPFTAWRDHAFGTRIADTVTLSTFHGCPPDEIEGITKHLMTRHGLDVVVKLNPTLLGFDRVHALVRGMLGYDELRLRRDDFDADLQFDRAVALIGDLQEFAAANGRRFGIKLTNTLVVENHRGVMPDDTMYLSGEPLHVVSTTLLGELHRALPGLLRVDGQEGPVQVSFSAGITKENLPWALGLGLTPVTICSDLLRPGGFGRLPPMLGALGRAMEAAGASDLEAWRGVAAAEAAAAGSAGPVERYVTLLHDPRHHGPYTRDGTSKLPRAVDSTLEMWGCVACNFCVTVCPNDAFFKVPTPDALEAAGRQQYLVFMELCNECGNCLTFCPEDGDPAVVKPRLYTDPGRFAAGDRPGFLLRRDGDRVAVRAAPGLEDEVGRVELVLNADEGLPLRLDALGAP
ncbi:MAG: 4Fe-4S dicluster domain-containing protein [Acidimicrobiia bacterium]|nr:4Fe-4S dicluster domain-containing protein [Acidimicrobiia bacterium]